MHKERGKFIVIYGANNLGKTEQSKRLVTNLKKEGFVAEYLKYPIYDLEPTGPRLNDILRKGTEPNLRPSERQEIFAQNRRDFEPQLILKLNSGIMVVGEDYINTGKAWGLTYDVDRKTLDEFNKGLLEEDIAILIDGEHRFSTGIERNHIHENSQYWEKNRDIHRELAREFGWRVVDGNQDMERVENDILNIVEEFIK